MKGLTRIIIGGLLCVSSSAIFAQYDSNSTTDTTNDGATTSTTTTGTTATTTATSGWVCTTDKEMDTSKAAAPLADVNEAMKVTAASCMDCTKITCTKQ